MTLSSLRSRSTVFIRNEHVFVLVTSYVAWSTFNQIFTIKLFYFEFKILWKSLLKSTIHCQT